MFKTKGRVYDLEVVLDALISILHKKAVVSRSDLQDEIILRSETKGIMVGGIEYRDEPDHEP